MAGPEFRVGQGDLSLRAGTVAGCQLGGAAQQGRRGRVAAAGARAFGGVLELGGEFLVGDYRGRGPVPGALVEVGLGAGRFGEGGVRAPPITIGRAVVGGGSQERMAEPDRVTGELKDAVRVRGGRVRVDSGLLRRPPQEAALTRDVGRRPAARRPARRAGDRVSGAGIGP